MNFHDFIAQQVFYGLMYLLFSMPLVGILALIFDAFDQHD
jgi:hypothetical protein